MTIVCEERFSDSPYVETVMHGHTLSDGCAIRPAETHWHMVFVERQGRREPLVVGPWSAAGTATWGDEAQILWIKFRLGVFMPHLPTKVFLDAETPLPGAASRSFWLKGSAWQLPDYENVEAFVARLVREEVLVCDPVVDTVLQEQPHELSPRTVRHRFLRATGLTQGHVYQAQRALRAAALLRHGVSILDTMDEAGYYDQPHLTRSLKRFIGYTPAQIAQAEPPT